MGSGDNTSGESGLEEVTEAELIKIAIEREQLDWHHSIPARVDSFDWNNGSPVVKVTPMVQRLIPDGDGNYTPESLPQLQDVPVKYYRCRNYIFVFPLAQGDEGTLFFADQNIGTWRTTGNVSDPGDIKRHGLDGAFFAPGLFCDVKPIQTNPGNNMILGRDGVANAQIEVTDSEVRLGAGATKGVVREGDHGDAGELTMVLGTLSGAPVFAAGSQYVDPDGSVTPFTGNTATVTLKTKATEKSDHVKAVD